jgi:hypothetical protein
MVNKIMWQHRTPGNKFFVSTTNVVYTGWETMVFPIREDGSVEYGEELDVERYNNENDAYRGHLEMYDKWQYIHIVKKNS